MSDHEEVDEAAEAERRRQEERAAEERRKKEAQARMKAAQAKKKGGKRKGLCLTPEKKKLLKDGQIQEFSDSDSDLEPAMTSSQYFSSTDGLSEPSMDSYVDDVISDVDSSHDVISIASDSGIGSNNSTLTREEVQRLSDYRPTEEVAKTTEESTKVHEHVEPSKTPVNVEPETTPSAEPAKTPETEQPSPTRKFSFTLPEKRRGIFVPSDRRVLERWRSQESVTSPERKSGLSKWEVAECAVKKQRLSGVWPPPNLEEKEERRKSLDDSMKRLSNESLTKWNSDALNVSHTSEESLSPRSQKNYGSHRGSWMVDEDREAIAEVPERPKIDTKAVVSITKEIMAMSRTTSVDSTDGGSSKDGMSPRIHHSPGVDKVKMLSDRFGKTSSIMDYANKPNDLIVDPVLASKAQRSKALASVFESKIGAKDEKKETERPKRTNSVLSRFQPQSTFTAASPVRSKPSLSNLGNSKAFSKSLGDLSSFSSVNISLDEKPKNIRSFRDKFEAKDSDSDDSVTLRKPRAPERERAKTMVEFQPKSSFEKRKAYQDDIDALKKSTNAKSLAERFQSPTKVENVSSPRPVSPTLKRNAISKTVSMLKSEDKKERAKSVDYGTLGGRGSAPKVGARGLAAKFEQIDANAKAQPEISKETIRRKSLGNPSDFFKQNTTQVVKVFDDSDLNKNTSLTPRGYTSLTPRETSDPGNVSNLTSKYATLDRNWRAKDARKGKIEMPTNEAEALKSAAKVTKLSSQFDQNSDSSSDNDSFKRPKFRAKSTENLSAKSNEIPVVPKLDLTFLNKDESPVRKKIGEDNSYSGGARPKTTDYKPVANPVNIKPVQNTVNKPTHVSNPAPSAKDTSCQVKETKPKCDPKQTLEIAKEWQSLFDLSFDEAEAAELMKDISGIFEPKDTPDGAINSASDADLDWWELAPKKGAKISAEKNKISPIESSPHVSKPESTENTSVPAQMTKKPASAAPTISLSAPENESTPSSFPESNSLHSVPESLESRTFSVPKADESATASTPEERPTVHEEPKLEESAIHREEAESPVPTANLMPEFTDRVADTEDSVVDDLIKPVEEAPVQDEEIKEEIEVVECRVVQSEPETPVDFSPEFVEEPMLRLQAVAKVHCLPDLPAQPEPEICVSKHELSLSEQPKDVSTNDISKEDTNLSKNELPVLEEAIVPSQSVPKVYSLPELPSQPEPADTEPRISKEDISKDLLPFEPPVTQSTPRKSSETSSHNETRESEIEFSDVNETKSEIDTSDVSISDCTDTEDTETTSARTSRSEYSEMPDEVGEEEKELEDAAIGGDSTSVLDMKYEDLEKLDKAGLLRKVQELYKIMQSKEEEKYDFQQKILKQDLEINEITSKVNDVKGKFTKPVLKKVTKTEKIQEKKKTMTDVRASLKSTGQSKYQLDDQDAKEPTTPDWRGGLGKEGKGKEGEEINGEVGGEEVDAEA